MVNNPDDSKQSFGRRSALKAISTATIGATVGSSVATADSDSGYDPKENVPYPNTVVYKYDKSLYEITSHPHLLALSEPAIDRHFAASDLEGKEYEFVRRYVANLRKRYPVEKVKSGNEIRFQLSDEARQNLTHKTRSAGALVANAESANRVPPQEGGVPAVQSDRDHDALTKAIGAFGGSSTKDNGGSATRDNVSVQWEPTHHTTILEDIASGINVSADFGDWAKDPDSFNEMANGRLGLDDGNIVIDQIPDIVPGKDWVEDKVGSALKSAIDRLGKNYTQFYDPGFISIPTPIVSDIKVLDVGMGPNSCQLFTNLAKSNYQDERFAAYASHYLQDMAVPLHTGMAVQQAGLVWDVGIETGWGGIPSGIDFDVDFTGPNRWLHYGYEGLVRNRWDSLKHHATGTTTASFSSAESAAKDLANESNRYSDNIFHTIYEEGPPVNANRSEAYSEWSSNTKSDVLENISNCLSLLGDYNRQLLLDLGFGEDSGGCPYSRYLC